MPRHTSDNCSIILDDNEGVRIKRSFNFKRQLDHEGSTPLVKKQLVQEWDKNVFGNVNQMKRSIMQEIKYTDKLEEIVDEGNHCLRLQFREKLAIFHTKEIKTKIKNRLAKD